MDFRFESQERHNGQPTQPPNEVWSHVPSRRSTDTHGTNEVNFALLHVFGYQFAPRYRDIYDKVSKTLYGFKHPSQYAEGLLLKPVRKLNPQLIIEEWENMQRIFVSLARKTTPQSIIVGKLGAYARKNKTRRALWEYDNIIRSLYLLDYIDSPPLRRHVQRALNRGESCGLSYIVADSRQIIWREFLRSHCIHSTRG